MSVVWLILVSTGLAAGAQLALKLGLSRLAAQAQREPAGFRRHALRFATEPWVLAWAAGYGLGLALWAAALIRAELSYAYPFLGLAYVIVGVTSVPLFGERLGARRIVGLLLISAGVYVIAVG